MRVTIRSTKRIRGAKTLPTLPVARNATSSDELKKIEDYIRSMGGKPLTKATRQKLIAAGCYGWPED